MVMKYYPVEENESIFCDPTFIFLYFPILWTKIVYILITQKHIAFDAFCTFCGKKNFFKERILV